MRAPVLPMRIYMIYVAHVKSVSILSQERCYNTDFKNGTSGRARKIFPVTSLVPDLEQLVAREITHRGPEQRTSTMLKSQPMRPVPITDKSGKYHPLRPRRVHTNLQ